MRVIVTGGTGMIGRALARSLLADGHEVIVLSRSPQARRNRLPEGVQVVGWDGRTAEGWGHLADGADAIVNLAGENIGGESFPPPRWTAARKQRILESRVNAGRAVVEAVRAAGRKPGVVIQASGVDYYGTGRSDPADEGGGPGTDFLAGVTVEWEQATQPVEELGVRRVIIRAGVVLSTEGGAFANLLIPFKMFVGGPLGSGKQALTWIHIDDMVRAIRFLIDNPKASGIYNVTAPGMTTNAEIAAAIGRALRRPSFFPVPAFALRLALGEVASMVLDSRRARPRRLEEAGFTWLYPEIEPAVRALLGRSG